MDEMNLLFPDYDYSEIEEIVEYFSEMELSDKQKEERIALAHKLQNRMMFVLSLIYFLSQKQTVETYTIQEMFRSAFLDAVGGEISISQRTMVHIEIISSDLAESTVRHIEEEETFSYERSVTLGEEEANTIYNNEDFEEALQEGYTMKTWKTMQDKKVRHTHMRVDDKTIPIEEYFSVGNCEMLFPRDEEADAEEVCNCRCTIEYS